MLPSEKAKELLLKFLGPPHESNTLTVGTYIGDLARKSAIICCNEIIESLKKYGTLVESATPQWIEPDTEYWEQVKKAIESL